MLSTNDNFNLDGDDYALQQYLYPEMISQNEEVANNLEDLATMDYQQQLSDAPVLDQQALLNPALRQQNRPAVRGGMVMVPTLFHMIKNMIGLGIRDPALSGRGIRDPSGMGIRDPSGGSPAAVLTQMLPHIISAAPGIITALPTLFSGIKSLFTGKGLRDPSFRETYDRFRQHEQRVGQSGGKSYYRNMREYLKDVAREGMEREGLSNVGFEDLLITGSMPMMKKSFIKSLQSKKGKGKETSKPNNDGRMLQPLVKHVLGKMIKSKPFSDKVYQGAKPLMRSMTGTGLHIGNQKELMETAKKFLLDRVLPDVIVPTGKSLMKNIDEAFLRNTMPEMIEAVFKKMMPVIGGPNTIPPMLRNRPLPISRQQIPDVEKEEELIAPTGRGMAQKVPAPSSFPSQAHPEQQAPLSLKVKKGSAEAKEKMARIRAMKGKGTQDKKMPLKKSRISVQDTTPITGQGYSIKVLS